VVAPTTQYVRNADGSVSIITPGSGAGIRGLTSNVNSSTLLLLAAGAVVVVLLISSMGEKH